LSPQSSSPSHFHSLGTQSPLLAQVNCSPVQVPPCCGHVPLALGSETPSGQTQRFSSPLSGLDFIPSGQRQRKLAGGGIGTQMWEQGLPEHELLPLRWTELKILRSMAPVMLPRRVWRPLPLFLSAKKIAFLFQSSQ